MKRIRILHVAQAAGGVDRYIRMLLKYLDKDKFENVLVCSQDFHEEDYNGLVDYFEQIEMTRAIGASDLKATKAVRKLIKKYNPDIVYAHSSKAGAIARIADIGLKNYCMYNPHGWAFNMRCSAKKKAIYTMIEKIAAPFCDKIICISDAEKQSALDKKICKEDKLQVIFNGVDIEAYENGAHGAVKRQGGCKTGRKDRKENRCRFGNCDPSGGAICDPSSCGGAGPAPAVAALFSCVGGKLYLSHAWQRPCQCVIRHLLRLGGYGPARGGRGLHSAGKRAGADGSEHRKHPSRL